ncbi:MAG: protein kinase [Planctomycetes bacterium]|nr:protein kinase [Planctomycetota bacterium]
MDCPQCKTGNPADARFCYRCGFTLIASGDAAVESSGTLLAITPGDEPVPTTEPEQKGGRKGEAPQPAPLGFAGLEDRYELKQLLGRGGMGAVYQALDRNLGRIVALKRVRQVSDNEAAWQRFTREAQSVAKMQHPNIVTVHDFGRDKAGPFLVMEYVEGETLAERLARRGALPPAQVAGVLEGVCAGVAHAHAKGVTHRDIKPANVIIDGRGVPKLLDFGLAREGTDSEMSQTGWFIGTPDYAAPEQKRDAKSVDHRADIYAIGAMLYEMLSGNRPVPLLLSKLPLHWQFVVGKACEPEPADRYQNIADFLEVVRNIPLNAAPTVPAPPKREQFNELACPDCGADNTLVAQKCVKCGASLNTNCALCGARRRVGVRNCTACGTNIVISSIALAHRDRAKRALEERRLRDSVEELTELEFLLTRSSDQLGPANEWFPWVRDSLTQSKQRIENAKKLAAKGRDAATRGMVGAAVRKLAQAAALDGSYLVEYGELAERAGIPPEQRMQQLAGADSEGEQRGTQFNTVTMGARNAPAPARVDAPMQTRVTMKVRCDACNVGILTRQEVIEKTRACPNCGAAPFKWHMESQAGGPGTMPPG